MLDASEEPTARRLAAEHGVEVELVPRRGIEPVATVTLVLVGAATAVGMVLRVLEQRKGGQMIDLRPGAPKAFYRTRDLVHGMVVIIAADGTVTLDVKEPEGMFGKVISTLPQLLSGNSSADEVAKTVTDTFSSDVQIEKHE
ncbi:hypothetical protein GCM10022247_36240 [Allokutzneria multivorans]|uniref:Uncharacterized protein n=1 Tax=Allokutzneria multivorans TaxID=1142134 RepID=A0ABP7SF34_9PSEU